MVHLLFVSNGGANCCTVVLVCSLICTLVHVVIFYNLGVGHGGACGSRFLLATKRGLVRHCQLFEY